MRTDNALVMTLGLALTALLSAGCDRSGQPDEPPPVATSADRATLARSLGRSGGSHETLGAMLADDAPVAVEAAFALGVLSTPEAVAELRTKLPADAPAEVVEAAALGLGYSRTESAEAALVELCLRDDPPENGLDALYAHYRGPLYGAADRTPPTELPDARLVRYAGLDSARARAGLCWLTRVIHDARLVGPVIALTQAAEGEVRRAAAMGLGQSSREGNQWSAEQIPRCVDALLPMLQDDDPRVVVSACRALSSYERDDVVTALRGALDHGDFNVRAAAVAALGRREAKDAAADLERLVRKDESVFVRYTAATTLAKLDASRARAVADPLLAAKQEYLRVAGCEVLGAAGGDDGVARLVAMARDDPHPRVRETALDALTGKEGESVVGALRYALESEADPVVVAIACGVAGADRVEAVHDLVRAVPARFPTFDGADAREGAVGALAAFGKVVTKDAEGKEQVTYELSAADRALIESHVDDEHPSVALTAARTLATVDGIEETPEPVRTEGPRGDTSDLGGSGDVLVVVTSKGTLRIQLDTEQAPIHCGHVTALAERLRPLLRLQPGLPRRLPRPLWQRAARADRPTSQAAALRLATTPWLREGVGADLPRGARGLRAAGGEGRRHRRSRPPARRALVLRGAGAVHPTLLLLGPTRGGRGVSAPVTGRVFNVQRYSLHDGPGIRTTVFLKGCPARCLWCHNPESQAFGPEVIRVETRCASCGTCEAVCPHGAPPPGSGLCTACGDCVEACPAGARELVGRETAVDEVMAEVLREPHLLPGIGRRRHLLRWRAPRPARVPAGPPRIRPRPRPPHRGGPPAASPRARPSWASSPSSISSCSTSKLIDARHRELTGLPTGPILDNLRALVAAHPSVHLRHILHLLYLLHLHLLHT